MIEELATTKRMRVIMSSLERRGVWQVPRELDVHVWWGNAELDLREAMLEPGVTTVNVRVTMGNIEIYVPPDMVVELDVTSFAANVEDAKPAALREELTGAPFRAPDSSPPATLRITGRARFGNVEVIRLPPGLTSDQSSMDCAHRERHERRRKRHERWRELRAERELWRRHRHHHRAPWLPWWLHARMRRRIFAWLAIALGSGIAIGVKLDAHPRWWQVLIGFFVLSLVSGAISWRLTRPLIMVVHAARDIGDGKLETRLDVDRHGGETRVLAVAINEMASKIQQQLADQRQLLAAVSHELRTPLGHMRVIVETARDTGDTKVLAGLDSEILLLDDLVGKLLASSRLEFGNLDRRVIDLGELVSDVVTAAGIAPEAIEAIGDVHAAVDPTLVRRAVANLIDNARVHGGGAVAVRITRRAGQVVIEVDDAGPGVPADRRSDAFRAFVPSSGGGLGLGLALVSRIAVAHGGGAWIDDRPDGGARVGFAVAITPPAARAPLASPLAS